MLNFQDFSLYIDKISILFKKVYQKTNFRRKNILDSIFFTRLFVLRTSQMSLYPTRETEFAVFSCSSSNVNVLGMEISMQNRKKIINYFIMIVMIITCILPNSFAASADDSKIAQPKTLPKHSVVEVAELSGVSTLRHQYASEMRNGVYYFVDNDLYLYHLEDNANEKIYSFGAIRSEYFANNKLYVAVSDMCYVFSLETHQIELSFKLEQDSVYAIGADDFGRIYVAGATESIYTIKMYRADGTYITEVTTENTVYCFDGFDSTTGNLYYETYYNWVYWGYDHPGKCVAIAKVSSDTIELIDISNSANVGILTYGLSCLEYACQLWYYDHNYNADYLGDGYLVTASTTFGRVQFVKNSPDGTLQITKTIGRDGTENSTNDYGDDSSIGVRAVYHKNRGSIIIYENGKVLNEYDVKTGEKRGTFTLQHYVYNLCKIGDTVVAIEKEEGKFYIELINWSDADSLEIAGAAQMKSGTAQQLQLVSSAAYSEQVHWSSSDDSVVSVSTAGVASAWHEGTATITCETADGKKKAAFMIQVTADAVDAVLNHMSLSSGIAMSSNVSTNDYRVWSKTVNSYLYENPDKSVTRVEYIGNRKVIVETYQSGQLTSSKTIDAELDIFGGFYHGDNYNYLVYGAQNLNDSDDVEVIRVVQYDKDFNRIASKSIQAVNTYIPFDAGSLRMTEAAGKLYIYTCHEMYQSSDGLHHQSNMTFVLNEETLEIVDSYFDVMNIAQAGYVSHSFNQFIKTDGKSIYRVDHGDAGPRAVSITKCDVGGSITSVSYRLLLNINGPYGANATGVSVGGLELSANNCIVVGNSVEQSDENTYNSNGTRNIFVSVTDKELNTMQTKWLTSYTDQDNITVRTPQLVKIDEAHFLVMWEEYNEISRKTVAKVTTIDEDATVTSPVRVIRACLSDCQPTVTADGKVVWYVTDDSSLVFYSLAPFALNQTQDIVYGDVNGDGEVNVLDAVLIKKHLAKFNVTIDEKAADVNVDNAVDVLDAVLLLKRLANMDVVLGP